MPFKGSFGVVGGGIAPLEMPQVSHWQTHFYGRIAAALGLANTLSQGLSNKLVPSVSMKTPHRYMERP